MESILKQLKLRKEEENSSNERIDLNSVNFLFKKKRTGLRSRRNDETISINKTSITVREKVLNSLGLNSKGSGALILHNQKLCLITSPIRDEELFALTCGGNKGASSLYIQIPSENTDVINAFKGDYKLENTVSEGDYKITELVKV